jgi:hypothetical protein
MMTTGFFDRAPAGTVPVAIRVGAGFAALYYGRGLVDVSRMASESGRLLDFLVPVAFVVLGILCCWGYWNLKRSAVIGLVALAAFYALFTLATHDSSRLWIFILGFRLLPLAPALYYWHRVPWR